MVSCLLPAVGIEHERAHTGQYTDEKMLVTVLESNHFQSRKTSNNITEYWVVEYSAEERKENSIRPQLPVQTGLEL